MLLCLYLLCQLLFPCYQFTYLLIYFLPSFLPSFVPSFVPSLLTYPPLLLSPSLSPVLRDVGASGLKTISREIAFFEDNLFADEGKALDPAKLAVGTFSIHNLGKPLTIVLSLTLQP